LILILLLFSCQKEENKETVKSSDLTYPDQEGWDSKVTTTQNGITNAIIVYGHMQRFKKSKIVEFDSGIEIDFFDEEGNHTSKLISDNGKLNETSNDIEAFGNVVVVSDSGISLETQHLWWDNNVEKVISDEFVKITTVEQDTFYGYGFESDQYLENWKINKIFGKTRKGLQLDLGIKKKDTKNDSVNTDSAAVKKEAVIDTSATDSSMVKIEPKKAIVPNLEKQK